MWNDLNHIIRVKWIAYLLYHSVVQYHNEMNNRVEQTQNWELRLNLLPLLSQRWNQNETMYHWTLMFQLECTSYSKYPAKYVYKFTNRRQMPWWQITMENLLSQEVIFYKNKKYVCQNLESDSY